uniref:ELAV-like protein 4 n=1 Tax=Aceria tosichella TaxID=561515 RepID=A0A6G1SLH3_9ACAR
MVDMKTEPEALTTTTTTTTTATTTLTTNSNEQNDDQVNDSVGAKIKNETAQVSTANNDNNNNSNNNANNNGAGAGEHEEEDDDDAEFDDEEDEAQNNNHQNGSKDDNEKTNLIVNYLPQQMTDEDFEQLFKKFGKMKSCKIVRNRITGYSYGFGFVDYETHEQALKAIEALNGQEVDTKKIKVAFARPAGQDIKQANLYVKNVPSSWSQEEVRKVFEPYGNIIQVRVLGNDRGVAFVLFDLRKQAQDALEALNGKQVDGCETPFEIKFAAEKKGEKQRNSRGGAGSGSGNKNQLNRRGGNRGGNFGGGGRNNQSNNNSNSNSSNNNNRNNRSNSNNRRSTSQGRGGNMFMKSNNNSNNGNTAYGSMNGGVGPMRQQQTNRTNRYAPFVPVQQPQPTMAPQPAPMTPYGYAQQPMLPYMMPGQPMMQMPLSQQSMPMTSAPLNPYSMGAQMAPIGYAQPPPMAQPSAAMNNMYNVASNTMNNAAQMQPQLGQPMNMRGNSSGGSSSGVGGGGGQSDGVTLFVYNIGPDCDENELKGMFTPYGTVVRCNVVRKTPGGETKGFGFVTLKNRENANSAIAGLNNTMRNGRSLQVSFKK